MFKSRLFSCAALALVLISTACGRGEESSPPSTSQQEVVKVTRVVTVVVEKPVTVVVERVVTATPGPEEVTSAITPTTEEGPSAIVDDFLQVFAPRPDLNGMAEIYLRRRIDPEAKERRTNCRGFMYEKIQKYPIAEISELRAKDFDRITPDLATQANGLHEVAHVVYEYIFQNEGDSTWRNGRLSLMFGRYKDAWILESFKYSMGVEGALEAYYGCGKFRGLGDLMEAVRYNDYMIANE